MSVHTLGEAWKLGWRIYARCYLLGENPKRGHRNKIVLCDTTAELDMKTLVWTRGEHCPLDALRERLRCPKCGGLNGQGVVRSPQQSHRQTCGIIYADTESS